MPQRINIQQIKVMAAWASGSRERRSLLWRIAKSEDSRVSANALWVMTHLPKSDADWLTSIRDELIDALLVETEVAKKRMMLQLLREQNYEAEDVRTDLLDYCLSKINSECEPYAIRCFCIYIAFKLVRHFPELITELEQHLEMMEFQALSPGLKCALRHTKSKILQLK